jgi:hypothetical protein
MSARRESTHQLANATTTPATMRREYRNMTSLLLRWELFECRSEAIEYCLEQSDESKLNPRPSFGFWKDDRDEECPRNQDGVDSLGRTSYSSVAVFSRISSCAFKSDPRKEISMLYTVEDWSSSDGGAPNEKTVFYL